MSSFAASAPAREASLQSEAGTSGVSWSAVFAGGFVGAALALVMIALGTGLGLAAVSPWAMSGASTAVIGTSAILWLIITQAASAGLGGYLAGRLRVSWTSLHGDEVYFRDTAHGLLVWALGVVVTASLLTSAALSLSGSSNSLATSRGTDTTSETTKYFVDQLFRSDRTSLASDTAALKSEAERIVNFDMRKSEISVGDQNRLTQLVSAATGMSASDASHQVVGVMEQIRTELDKVRRAAAHSLLWIFVSLLSGAFCASFAATVGGKQRDRVAAAI